MNIVIVGQRSENWPYIDPVYIGALCSHPGSSIFIAIQVLEKPIEKGRELFVAFADLEKA